MATPIVSFGAAAGGFVNTVSITAQNVGTGANRAAYVAIGASNATDVPSSVTVGTDTLTARGSVFVDGAGWRWRLYAGLLTVTGSQTITANWTDSFNNKFVCGVVFPDVGAAIIEGLATGGALTSTQQPTFTVASRVGDTVVSLLFLDAEAAFTPSSPAIATTGTGLGGSRFVHGLYEAGAASVTIDGTVGGPTNVWRGFGFNVPAGAAAGPTINTQPINASVTAPTAAVFTVAATSSGGTLTYQWQRSIDSGTSWANVPDGTGPTSATYTTTATAVSSGNHRNGYRYRCAVSDNNGTTNTSAAILTVTAPPLAVTLDPLVDASNALRTSYTVDKVWAIRVSDNVLVATWTNQTTNGSGVLPALSNAGLTAVPHVFITWDDNATPNNAGAKVYTPA